MTDLSKLSDFEINKMVAEKLGLKIKFDERYDDGVVNDSAVVVHSDDLELFIVDYCNNPNDAWPIIVENKINLLFHDVNDSCAAYTAGEADADNQNPLRAAMEVFLQL